MRLLSRFEDAIESARRGGTAGGGGPDTSTLDDGPDVQLSVRVPQGLRAGVASTAHAQGLTMNAFVQHAMRRAVVESNDSFGGLAAELARNVRATLRSTIEDGAYREAAAGVEREEAWS